MISGRLNGSAQRGVGSIDHRGSLSDCDGLSRRAHDQRDVYCQRLTDCECDILLHKAFKSDRLGLNVIAHRKVVDAVLAIAVRRRRPGKTRYPGL